MSKEAKRLNKEWLGENDIMIRRPSDDEQREARVKTSDYQISSITIQSSILFSLGLIEKIYRSKSATVSLSTSNKIKKYKSILDKLLFNLKFIDNMKDFYKFISDYGEIHKRTNIDLKFFLKGQKKWENVLNKDHILPIIVPFVKEDPNSVEYTEEEVVKCKDYFNLIYPFLEKQSKLFDNPSLYFDVLTLITSFNSILNDDIMEDISDSIMSYDGTIESFKDFYSNYLKEKDRGSIKKHTQTIIDETCLKNQKIILNELKEDGLADKLTLKTFITYLTYYRPQIFDNFKNCSGLDLRNYENFDELCDALYQPECIQKIRNDLDVNVRARCSGDLRKGAELIIEQKRYNNKRENAKRKLGCEVSNYNYDNDVYKLEQKKKEYISLESEVEELKSQREKLKEKISLEREKENKIEISLLKSNLRLLDESFKIKNKNFKDTKREYKSLLREIQNKKRAYDTIKHYEKMELDMYGSMKENRNNDDYYEITLLEQRTRDNFICEDKIPYFTWQFICYDMDMDVANLLCETLEKHLNEGTGICGESGYINAAAYSVGFHMGKPLVHFFIDYPKSAAIYKAFKKKKNLSEILLKGFSDCMNISITCIKDETKFNVPMEITLKEDSYSWDTFWN